MAVIGVMCGAGHCGHIEHMVTSSSTGRFSTPLQNRLRSRILASQGNANFVYASGTMSSPKQLDLSVVPTIKPAFVNCHGKRVNGKGTRVDFCSLAFYRNRGEVQQAVSALQAN